MTPTSTSTSVTKERAKPELVTVGKKTIISGGRWNDHKMADYVFEHGQKKWVKVGELAKVLGANTQPNKKRVRTHTASLFRTFRDRGLWLAVEYAGDHGGTTAVKVADIRLEADRQAVTAQCERMNKRKQMSEEEFAKSMALLNSMESLEE